MRSLLLVLLWLMPQSAFANDDLITIQSAHSAPVTVQRLQKALTADGWTILATIDHAAAALADARGIKTLARTTIVYAWMGGWTVYLIEKPTMALDGPTRLLVWEDHEGVWVTRSTLQHYLRHVVRRHEAKGFGLRDQALDDKLAALIDNATRQ
jgi:uncharacterized protein (DUF302 family)